MNVTFTTSLWSQDYHYPHFQGEESEVKKGKKLTRCEAGLTGAGGCWYWEQGSKTTLLLKYTFKMSPRRQERRGLLPSPDHAYSPLPSVLGWTVSPQNSHIQNLRWKIGCTSQVCQWSTVNHRNLGEKCRMTWLSEPPEGANLAGFVISDCWPAEPGEHISVVVSQPVRDTLSQQPWETNTRSSSFSALQGSEGKYCTDDSKPQESEPLGGFVLH